MKRPLIDLDFKNSTLYLHIFEKFLVGFFEEASYLSLLKN